MSILLHGYVYKASEIEAGDVRWLSRIELRKLLAEKWLRYGVREAASKELARRLGK